MNWLDILGGLCMVAGGLFGVVGALGALRFPDFFTRLHAAGITDTLCAALILTGLMLQSESWQPVVKLVLVLAFLLFTTPTATHALANTAIRAGFRPPASRNEESP